MSSLEKQARDKRYYEKHKEKIKAKTKAYKEAHPEQINNVRRWHSENIERIREIKKKYESTPKGIVNHKIQSAKRRARKVSSTPKWANLDMIRLIYEQCPMGYHVDHIYPLQGKEVCGLHVETNLQYLPALENIKKRNKFPELQF